MKKAIALSLCLVLTCTEVLFPKVKSDKSMYVGGTVAALKQGVQGVIDTDDEKVMTFEYKDGKLSIPYDRINDLEYGQKAGRRLGLAIAITPLFLFSKKRKHFLTVGYQDENDKQQAAVFEVGKNSVRVTITALEARSGRKVEYQDEEARKSGMGN